MLKVAKLKIRNGRGIIGDDCKSGIKEAVLRRFESC